MKLLVLGYSNIFQRKLLPLVSRGVFDIDIELEVASKSKVSELIDNDAVVKTYSDYNTALSESNADVVYISTVNSLHAELCLEGLKKGFHVLVDKPIMATDAQIEEITRLAELKKCCVSEVIVWNHHSQIEVVKALFIDKGETIKHINASFTFPPLATGNFRNKHELGGGVFNDLGPYLVGVANCFFDNEAPASISSFLSEKRDEVFESMTALLKYKTAGSLTGFFSFNSQYVNRLELFSDSMVVVLDRAFTTPEDFKNNLIVKENNNSEIINLLESDSFFNYFNSVFNKIELADYQSEIEQFERNGKLFNSIKKVTGS